jgi:putative ABC transport system permease protein
MEIPMVRGRELLASDMLDAPAVAVINDAAAKRFFPNEDPIGRRIVWFSWDPIEATPRTIVGVIGDVRHRGLAAPPDPEVFIPLAQAPVRTMQMVVRTEGDPLSRAGDLKAALAPLDPSLPAPRFTTLEEVVATSLARPRFTATLLALFAALALALASVGIGGLLAYSVEQRTREFGVRVALGAAPGEILRLVASRAVRLVVTGLVLGLAGASSLSLVVESLLYGVSPHDPASFAAVILLIALASLVASAIPARRAATVDPMVALRHD